MRNAETILGIIRDERDRLLGERCDTETVMHRSGVGKVLTRQLAGHRRLTTHLQFWEGLAGCDSPGLLNKLSFRRNTIPYELDANFDPQEYSNK